MAANTAPIYSRAPNVQVAGAVIGPSANTAFDGTGANTYEIFNADATEGSFVYKVILRPIGATAATVARLFVCTDTGAFTAGTTNTVANTAPLAEVTLPLIATSQVAAQNQFEIPLNYPLNPGFKLLMTFGTSTGAAGVGYNPVTIAGKY